MFIGGIIAVLFALFISFACFRYGISGFFFAMVTLVFAEVIYALALRWEFIGGGVGIFLPVKNSPIDFAFTTRIPFYYIILGMVLIAMFITYLISKSKLGYYLKAIREDEDAAMVLGVNAPLYKTLVMAISAYLTALGGTFYAQLFLYINPDVVLGKPVVFQMLFNTIVGGSGTILGPVIGAVGLNFLGETLRSLPFGVRETGAISLILYGSIAMLVVIYFPEGIVKLFERIDAQRWLKVSQNAYASEISGTSQTNNNGATKKMDVS
jgi:branched-chain amino acid transport system permease protein